MIQPLFLQEGNFGTLSKWPEASKVQLEQSAHHDDEPRDSGNLLSCLLLLPSRTQKPYLR